MDIFLICKTEGWGDEKKKMIQNKKQGFLKYKLLQYLLELSEIVNNPFPSMPRQ